MRIPGWFEAFDSDPLFSMTFARHSLKKEFLVNCCRLSRVDGWQKSPTNKSFSVARRAFALQDRPKPEGMSFLRALHTATIR